MTDAPQLTEQQVAALRLLSARGMVEEEILQELLGKRELFRDSEVGLCLASLGAAGAAESMMPGFWCVTEEGKKLLRRHLRSRRADVLPHLRGDTWAGFEKLDMELKAVCVMWQVKQDGSANDHDDTGYDFSILEKLGGVHARLHQLIDKADGLKKELTDLLLEMDGALGKVNEGGFEFFTGFTVNSYHNLWFELHEDLLCTLGLERKE